MLCNCLPSIFVKQGQPLVDLHDGGKADDWISPMFLRSWKLLSPYFVQGAFDLRHLPWGISGFLEPLLWYHKENESVIDSLFILYILIKEQYLHRLYTRRSTISGEILGYNIVEKYSINSSRISPHLLIYLVHIWNHNYLGFFPSIIFIRASGLRSSVNAYRGICWLHIIL